MHWGNLDCAASYVCSSNMKRKLHRFGMCSSYFFAQQVVGPGLDSLLILSCSPIILSRVSAGTLINLSSCAGTGWHPACSHLPPHLHTHTQGTTSHPVHLHEIWLLPILQRTFFSTSVNMSFVSALMMRLSKRNIIRRKLSTNRVFISPSTNCGQHRYTR